MTIDAKTIRISGRCPIKSLLPSHFRNDGSCHCLAPNAHKLAETARASGYQVDTEITDYGCLVTFTDADGRDTWHGSWIRTRKGGWWFSTGSDGWGRMSFRALMSYAEEVQ